MPYFSIETSLAIEKEPGKKLAKKVSAFVSDLLGKPESYVMVAIKPESVSLFGGSDRPCAFVRLKSIGLSRDMCGEYSANICGFIEEELKIPKDRIYIDFSDLDGKMFGWNAKTF
jgi:phenylpyruvate tautomerase